MAAKFFIDGTFFVPVCSLCLKLNFISLSMLCFSNFLCFTLFLLLFEIFMQICAAITEKCILSYSSVNVTDNLLIFWRGITFSLIIISDTGRVILATHKLMSATEATLKVIWAT